MADKTIFELDPLGAQPADTDGFELERPGAPGTPYYVLYGQLKQTSAQILAGVGASFLTLTDLAATPADADYFFVWDSSAAALKRVLYTDLIPTQSVADLDPLGVAPAVGDLIEILDINDLTDGPDGTAKKLTVALLFTSPTFVTPALGVPASGILTNCTGLPTAGLVDGAVTLAKLQSIAANKIFGRATVGTGVPELIDFSTAAQQLCDDASFAAMRTTLGLLSMALQDAGNVLVTGGAITGTTVDGVMMKAYVDNLVAGLKWKETVKVATTAAGTLASDFENGDTVDGVVLTTGDRILIKDQAAGAENGIYIVAASGAPTRATDADAGSELVNATVFVEQGTVNADLLFVCTNNAITLGVTAIVFVNFGATPAGALLATNNLSDLANAGTARTNLGLGALAVKSTVATGDIDASAVTLAKMANVAERGLFLRTTAGTGAPEVQVLAADVVSLLAAANYAAIRSALGLVIGTNVQAWSAGLDDLAARWVVASASGPASLDFREDADNGTNRVRVIAPSALSADFVMTLPAADDTFAALALAQTFTNKRITPRVQSVASAATVTPNADADDMVLITAQAEALTLANPTGTPTEGQKLIVRIKDNLTARAISYGSQYRALGNTLPTPTTLGKWLVLGFLYSVTDTKWDLVSKTEQA